MAGSAPSPAPRVPSAPSNSIIPLEEAGLVGEVAVRGEAICIPNTRLSTHRDDWLHEFDVRARAILPIVFDSQVVGVLDLYSSHQVAHARHELLSLQLLADQLGVAAQNASLYEQSLRARAAAEEADQLKTRLLANVSHELRTPINLILGYSQLMLKEAGDTSERWRGDLAHIAQSGEHLVRLINDLLDMSRLEIDALDLHPEILAPRPFLENVFASVAGQHEGATVA